MMDVLRGCGPHAAVAPLHIPLTIFSDSLKAPCSRLVSQMVRHHGNGSKLGAACLPGHLQTSLAYAATVSRTHPVTNPPQLLHGLLGVQGLAGAGGSLPAGLPTRKPLDMLSDDLLVHVLSALDSAELRGLAGVCRRWAALLQERGELWQSVAVTLRPKLWRGRDRSAVKLRRCRRQPFFYA